MTCFAPLLYAILLALGPIGQFEGPGRFSVRSEPESPPVQCRALDALGTPIPKALIQTWTLSKTGEDDDSMADSAMTTTDDEGRFMLPERQTRSLMTVVRLLHADYGTAEARFTIPFDGSVRFPLVKTGSEEEKTALRGTVRDPEGRPVAGARVELSVVRSPDERLITGGSSRQSVYTDKAGRFRIYPLPHQDAKVAALPNAIYDITVVQPSYALFPHAGRYKNSEEVAIHLNRPELAHHFVLMGTDGQPMPAEEVSHSVSIRYDKVSLPPRFKTGQVKLVPGRYEASYADGHHRPLWYQPVEVTKDSPEELAFRFPAPLTFAGRVVDGLTGKPRAGVFVLGMTGVGYNNLASLTAEEWQALHALPAAPDMQDPALQPLHRLYGFEALVRTDADGKYAITQPPGTKLYGVIAFDEGLLPFNIRVIEMKADEHSHVALPDSPLFPAATVLIKPVFEGPSGSQVPLSVGYDWRLEEAGQPEWFARFPRGTYGNNAGGYIERLNWLKLNEEQSLYVPAGLRFRLEFSTPYHGQWVPRKYPEILLIEPGQSKKLDDLTFTAAP
jgi:hypothetical protein